MKNKDKPYNPLDDGYKTTKIFKVEKKYRRNDSIAWIIVALLLIFFSLISLARLTIVGQFFDDALFTFLFGWFKYCIYLLLFITSILVFMGVKIRIKYRVKWMIIVSSILLCWMVSNVLVIIKYFQGAQVLWDSSIFLNILKNYFNNWYETSIFAQAKIKIVEFNGQWISVDAGGGIIGNGLLALFSYTSIIGSTIFFVLAMLANGMWIFTGSVFYFFKSKQTRVNRGIKIMILASRQRNKRKKQKTTRMSASAHQNLATASSVDLLDPDRSQKAHQLFVNSNNSDITLQFPSFNEVFQEGLINEFESANPNGNSFNMNNYPNQAFNQPNQYSVKSYNTTSNEYIKPRRKVANIYSDIENLPVYNSSTYGKDVSLEDARKKLNDNALITPFKKLKSKTQQIAQGQNTIFDENCYGDTQDFHQKAIEVTLNHRHNRAKNQASDIKITIEEETINDSNNNFDLPLSQTNLLRSSKPIVVKKQVINYNYQLPPLTLLREKQINNNKEVNIQYAREKAQKIDSVFNQFSVQAKVSHINIGPTITKFEIQPQLGTKVQKIISLENDLKLALANQNIRLEAPIQGKSAVGVEIPNARSNMVTLREVMEKIPFEKSANKLLTAIGKTVMGELLFSELDKMPHLLIAGSTGSGKSICVNAIICSLILRTNPYEVKLLLIDPKRVELAVYKDLPHLIAPVISGSKEANNALKKIISEMERRYTIFSQQAVRNIESYNNKVTLEEKLPYIVVIIDELADLMVTTGKEVEESIMRITQMARAAGIHLIIATQRPSTDILTGVIKTNIPSRIAFAVASSIDSRTILDGSGAEKLIGKGDMLYAPAGQNIATRSQGVFISDEEIQILTDYCSRQQEPSFEEEFLNSDKDHNQIALSLGTEDNLYEDVKRFVITNQRASTSLIQRKFSIGYNRASRLMDALEENGVVGPQNGSKPREIFINNFEE